MSFTKFFRRRRRDEDAAREIASYIAIETDDNIARGMPPQAAHDAAVRKFGNADPRARGDLLDEHDSPTDTLWQDLRFAVRLLRRDKGFAVAAILSLALGIGANTAIFQLLDAVRLRTLPVREPEQLRRGALQAGHVAQRQLHQPLADADLSAVRRDSPATAACSAASSRGAAAS